MTDGLFVFGLLYNEMCALTVRPGLPIGSVCTIAMTLLWKAEAGHGAIAAALCDGSRAI